MRSTANQPTFLPERKNKPEGIIPTDISSPLPETARGFFMAAVHSPPRIISRISLIGPISSVWKTGDLVPKHVLRGRPIRPIKFAGNRRSRVMPCLPRLSDLSVPSGQSISWQDSPCRGNKNLQFLHLKACFFIFQQYIF